nr:response regulator transcription factor [Eubacterium sp.]
MTDILIVEDNAEIGGLLKDFLAAEGYSVVLADTGEKGVEHFRNEGAKLVVLDIMLPGMDGFAVCQEIRENSNAPIIIVSAKGEKEDKLNGLLLGADDYMEKPYDIDILIAKVKGIFKRRYESAVIKCGNIKLDKEKRLVYKAGEELTMTAKEYELLQLLMENSGKVLSKDMLFNKIWGFDSFSEPQTLTVHIKRLREKVEEDPTNPTHIQTVWGVGYRFEEV